MEIPVACTNHDCPLRGLCGLYMDNAPGDELVIAYRRYAPSTHGNVVTCEHYVSAAALWRREALSSKTP